MYKMQVVKHKNTLEHDTLRIKGLKVVGNLNILKFKDADTDQFVIFVPALEISGYGETEEKANKMAEFSVKEYFTHLNSLSIKKREEELFNMGWRTDKLRTKDYSKAFVDIDGRLQDFNAAEGKIEHLTLETA